MLKIVKNRVLIIIQCRFNSTRLYGKALLQISGIPMLSFLIRRLRSGLPENEYQIVVATTKLYQDDAIEALGLSEGVEVFRGEENDVLKRYVKCLECYPAKAVVRVTADNPLTCPDLLKWLVMEKLNRGVDYIFCTNLPKGAGVDVFSSWLVKDLDKKALKPDEREHINLYILRNFEKYFVFFLTAKGEYARPDLRITVDTGIDLRRVRYLLRPFEHEPWKISLHDVIQRMDTHHCLLDFK